MEQYVINSNVVSKETRFQGFLNKALVAITLDIR